MPVHLPHAVRSRVKAALRPTVSTLVRDLVAEENGGEAFVAPATEVLLHRIGGMAPHLAMGMSALTLGFSAWGLARGGRPFPAQSRQARARRFEEWRALPGPLASWVQFYEKMGVFVYWAVVEEAEHGSSGASEAPGPAPGGAA